MSRQRVARPPTAAPPARETPAARSVTPAPRLPAPCHRGNQSLQALLRTRRIQASFTIGEPGDPYEREAERVADEVMRPAAPAVARTSQPPQLRPPIQRQCSECEEAKGKLARQPADPETKEEEGALEAQALPGRVPEVSRPVAARIESLRSGGEPLSAGVRSFFAPRFGSDFSHPLCHQLRRAEFQQRHPISFWEFG